MKPDLQQAKKLDKSFLDQKQKIKSATTIYNTCSLSTVAPGVAAMTVNRDRKP